MNRSLESGGRFVIDPLPQLESVTAALWVPYGSRHDDRSLSGVSHLLEHVVVASESTAGGNCARHVAALGGRTDAVTTPEFTAYAMTVPHTAWEETWKRLEVQYGSPDFSNSAVDTQKLTLLDEIAGAESVPERQIHASAMSRMLGEHRLGYPAVGRSKDIAVRTPSDLRDAHRRQLGAAPRLIVSGNVDSSRAADILAGSPLLETEGSAEPHHTFVLEPARARVGFERTAVASSRSHVLVSWFLPDRTPADDLPLAVVNRLAGGATGGVLQLEFHGSEGAYSSHTSRSLFSDCAVWSAYLSCSAQFIEEAVERIVRAVNRTWNIAVKDEGARERASIALAGSLAIGLESTVMRVNWIGRRLLDGKDAAEKLGSATNCYVASSGVFGSLRDRLMGPHVTIFEGDR